MHVILWRFRARAGRESEFEAAYGPDGSWAKLFRSDPNFLGTDLLRASDGAYLTLDRWRDAGAFEAFRRRERSAYDALDVRCGVLTESETPLGSVEI